MTEPADEPSRGARGGLAGSLNVAVKVLYGREIRQLLISAGFRSVRLVGPRSRFARNHVDVGSDRETVCAGFAASRVHAG